MTNTHRGVPYRALGPRYLPEIGERYGIDPSLLDVIQLNATVLPFRTNSHILNELIDWSSPLDDPVFRLVFPLPGALPDADVERIRRARAAKDERHLSEVVNDIRAGLNPHPAGQREQNVPTLDGGSVAGVQHKYRETVLYFPRQGQSCHGYCSYCFRWPQFVGDEDLRFEAGSPDDLIDYLRRRPAVTDVLLTGGDPMMMSTHLLEHHITPLLDVETVRTIRIGTKALGFWPYRFTTDRDADALLRLIETVRSTGRQVAIMNHVSLARELATAHAELAVQRLRAAGALMFGQAPIMAGVNDSPLAWHELWIAELARGITPYYMFVARDTGAHDLFKVPLVQARAIFNEAYSRLPGLARTVRGRSCRQHPESCSSTRRSWCRTASGCGCGSSRRVTRAWSVAPSRRPARRTRPG